MNSQTKQQLRQAFEDWLSLRAYVNKDDFRYKEGGRIVPWNRLVKGLFPRPGTCEAFHRAAHHYQETNEVFSPTYLLASNIRIARYPKEFVVEVWADAKCEGYPQTVKGMAADVIVSALRIKFPSDPIWQGQIFGLAAWLQGTPNIEDGGWEAPRNRRRTLCSGA